MDTKQRLFAKALTWQGMGFVVMTGVGWLFTGSVSAGGGIALAGAVSGMAGYILHEAAWARVAWGQVSRTRERS